jgi:hemolysin activation/secretion protein
MLKAVVGAWIGRGALLLLLALLVAPGASAQVFGPAEERPELEPFEPEGPPPAPLELPPVPAPAEEDRLSAGLMVFVREFVVEGSSVFTPEDFAAITTPYTGRRISSEELLQVRDAVTAHYIQNGYVTSGAVIPDQAVEDGEVRIQIVEGKLSDVVVEGTRWFRARYFRDRLLRAGRAPVSVVRLERQLQLLQRNPYVQRVNARLEPGDRLGESALRLVVDENRPYSLVAETGTLRSPSVGGIGGRFTPSFANLLGLGDVLKGNFDITEGLWEYDLSYELPLNSYDTRLALRFRDTDSDVVENPFDALGIHSDARTYGFSLSQPLLRNERHDLWFRIVGERRESESCVKIFPPKCEPFAFLPGTDDPEQKVSVLRFVQDWSWRTDSDVVAARSTASVGLDVLGATTSGDSKQPDSQFFAWLGQVQWAHRFSERFWSSELVFRTDLQLATDPLMSLEKIAVGGLRTVRGYRENQIVRDNGFVSSIELRIPVYRTPLGRPLVQLIPFVDVGRAWDERDELTSETLASIGVGVRVSPLDWIQAELYWGGRLTDVPNPGENTLQDDGLQLRIRVWPFHVLPR